MSLFGKKVSGVKAKLDTGASQTAVPMNILQLLQIHQRPARSIPVTDYNNYPFYRSTYYVDIIHPEFTYRGVEVIGIDRGATMLIGRDIINRWRLLLNGQKQIFDFRTS